MINFNVDLDKMFKSKSLRCRFFVLLLFLLIPFSYMLGYTKGNQNPLVQINQNNTSDNHEVPTEDQVKPCVTGVFEEEYNSWIFNSYSKPDKEGYYCPKVFSNYQTPDIWYKEKLPHDFESFTIKYKLRSKQDDLDTYPPFIFSIGESPRILRFYWPEGNPLLVGFEKINLSNTPFKLEREQPQELLSPIKLETEAKLMVRPSILQDNKMNYVFNLSYISQDDNKEDGTFTYEVVIPDPDPQSTKISIGFGTTKSDGCLKPISYELCE